MKLKRDKEKYGRLCAFKDTAASMEYEEALRKSEERYRKLVELLPDPVIVHSDGKIVFANTAAYKLASLPKDSELIGKPIEEFIPPEYKEIINERIGRIIQQSGDVPLIEEKFIKPDGNLIDVEVTATSFTFETRPASLVVIRDITEKKRIEDIRIKMEENIRKLNETIEYDRIKTEFFANISHEFRTPLNVIIGALQMMDIYSCRKPEEGSNEKLCRYVTIMKQNCMRLLKLVNNLIDITKINSGYMELNLSNENIVQIVEDITLSVAEYIENKSIELEFDTEIEEKYIACDTEKIERVLLNLLSNAAKFTRPGGKISVYVEDSSRYVSIYVKDTGIGIPEDKLSIIFERFGQANKLLTRDHEGSGIGLSLVKSMVEMHGGDISVRSTYGKGSTFIVRIPARRLENYPDDTSDTFENMDDKYIERINIEFSDVYSI